LSEYGGVEFPPDIEEGYDEPIGIVFARKKHNEAIWSNLEALLMGMTTDTNNQSTNDSLTIEPADDDDFVGLAVDDAINEIAIGKPSFLKAAAASLPSAMSLPRTFLSIDTGLPAAT
jgi:hypothetical protein